MIDRAWEKREELTKELHAEKGVKRQTFSRHEETDHRIIIALANAAGIDLQSSDTEQEIRDALNSVGDSAMTDPTLEKAVSRYRASKAKLQASKNQKNQK
jgi:tripartite-type tricarboxylate transporter receptor subunit TctC